LRRRGGAGALAEAAVAARVRFSRSQRMRTREIWSSESTVCGPRTTGMSI
jgi:hypothetical protein